MSTTTIEKRQGTPTRAERARGGRVYCPNVDILENQEELLLLADVPGAKPEDVEIQYDNGELAIQVTVDGAERDQGERFLRNEYGVGDFCRSFQLGEAIDHSKIRAEVRNGVLTVHLPKAEAAKPRKIAVKPA